MYLQREDSIECPAFGIVVGDLDGLKSVEPMLEMVSTSDDPVFVPVFVFVIPLIDKILLLVAEGTRYFRFSVRPDLHLFADVCQILPAFLFVEEADFALLVLDLGLVTACYELPQVFRTVLDAGVSVLNAEFYLQLEILHRTGPPHKERIALLRGGCFATQDAVFRRPQLRFALPSGEVFSIEDRIEIGIGRMGCHGSEREGDKGAK